MRHKSASLLLAYLLAVACAAGHPCYAQENPDGLSAAELEAKLAQNDDPSLRMDLAEIYRKAGMTDKAIQQFKKITESKNAEVSTLQDAWYRLGRCYGEKKDYVNGSFAFNESLRIDRFNPKTLQANVELWQEVVKADPAANNHIGLAVAYQYQGEFVKAGREYKEALKVSPVNEIARRQLANLPQLMRDYRRDILINEGSDLHALGLYDQAITSYEMANRLDPQNTTALFDLGCVFAAKREFDKAREWYQRVLAIDPKDERTRKALDDISKAK